MTAGRIAAILFVVLAAAALAVLVVSQNIRSRLVVDQIEISKALVPSADGRARIRFRLTEDEERATVEVIDSDGAVVETLAENEPLGDYEIHRFRWAGDPGLDDGAYRVRLTLDSLDREIVLPEEVDVSTADG